MTLREKILQCLEQYGEDEILVPKLNTIIAEDGLHACKIILHILTQLEMSEEEAAVNWEKILINHRKLVDTLNRNISLRTAICDYFCSINQALINPTMVEIDIFEKAIQKSMHDSLTGLLNRSAFDNELIRETSRAERDGSELSLLFLDIDDFKKVNDDFGHQAGDLVLKNVADTIECEKRIIDIAARYGGEEFVIILPNTEMNEAMLVGERIRKRLENKKYIFKNSHIAVTLSGGLASFPSDADNIRDLIHQADLALYRAKTSGKDRISLFSPDKRRFVRINTRGEIKVMELGFTNPARASGESKNLSIGGVLFQNTHPFKLGSTIQLNIAIGHEPPLLAIGKVVRVEKLDNGLYDIGVSLSLSEIDKTVKERITMWLRNQDS